MALVHSHGVATSDSSDSFVKPGRPGVTLILSLAGLDGGAEVFSPENELNSTGYDDAYDVTLSEGDCAGMTSHSARAIVQV